MGKRRSWRANYITLRAVRFMPAIGFTGSQPFVPLYIQELGVTGARDAAVCSGIFGAVGGLTTARLPDSGAFWPIATGES